MSDTIPIYFEKHWCLRGLEALRQTKPDIQFGRASCPDTLYSYLYLKVRFIVNRAEVVQTEILKVESCISYQW